MINLYFHSTPNSMKVALLLEELKLSYDVNTVDILKGEQHSEQYLAINPNGKVPALRDGDVTIFDSHAILLYLAKKHAQFLPETDQSYASALSWLQFVGTGLSPFSGQAVHFLHYAPEPIAYAKHRYVGEVERHYLVLDKHLANNRYLAGDQYTIADMALWGWAISAGYVFGERALSDYPNVQRLVQEISARPSALKALAIREGTQVKTAIDDESLRALFPRLHSANA
jgi:GSH-dependent disulfide-bond oxidoreductase